jgi:hypothetical protein
MIFPLLTILLAFSAVGTAQDKSLAEVRTAFNNANVSYSLSTLRVTIAGILKQFVEQLPETIKFSFDPKVLLEVTFPQTDAKSITLHAGIQLPRNGTDAILNSPRSPVYLSRKSIVY